MISLCEPIISKYSTSILKYFQFKIYFFYSKYTEIFMNPTSALFLAKNILQVGSDLDLENIFLEINTHFRTKIYTFQLKDDHEVFLSQKYTIFIPE